ncbi:MAG TPA: nuclear transport factor 2 family protein [Stellaceae bacterium]|nr:nuclear transport factor 2 family protein [Stellaceae bacterium]
MSRLGVAAVVALAALAAPAFADPAENAFADAVRALEAMQVAAYNRHDAATVASIFTDDAVSLTPGGILSGRAAIETYLGGLMSEQDWRDYAEGIDEAHLLAADAGWARGHWSVTTRTPAGEAHRQGLWSAVYVLEKGAWKARMDSITALRMSAAK